MFKVFKALQRDFELRYKRKKHRKVSTDKCEQPLELMEIDLNILKQNLLQAFS